MTDIYAFYNMYDMFRAAPTTAKSSSNSTASSIALSSHFGGAIAPYRRSDTNTEFDFWN